MTDPWPGLEIRHLLALVAVAEEASFSRAAERLGYTQSAVSQQIARLEKIVGAELVERPGGPRPVRPTDAGEIVLTHARTVLAQVRAAEAEVLAVAAGEGGRVRVGTVQSVGTKILPEVLRRFRALRPGVAVELEEAHDPAVLLDRLADGELDLAFCEEPMPPGRWGTRHVLDDPFILLAPAGSPEAGWPSVSVEEVGKLALIGYRNPSCLGLMVAAFEGTPNAPNFVFHSDDNGTIQGCVGAGLAHALVFLLTVDEADPTTVIVPIDPPLPPRRINLAWQADRPLSNAQVVFADVVTEVCVKLFEPPAARGVSWVATAGAVARRPGLWPTAARQVRRLAPTRWWRRPPFLPTPDRAWLRFRMETQYGDPHHRPAPDDVVAWLEWARRYPG